MAAVALNIPELKREVGNGTHIYQCEHITSNMHPVRKVIPVGDYANILLCKRCWEHIVFYALRETVVEAVKHLPIPQLLKQIEATRDG